MLKHLRIENYALIREADIDFSKGFTAITGETGAGKSIMLGALGLVLGLRADTGVIQDSERKCIVEATFLLKEKTWKHFFDSEDLDFEPQSILRREILPNGKTRAFINDTPVNLSSMKNLGDRLVNIHSQHETLTIKESDFQLKMVDSFIENQSLTEEWRTLFSQYRKDKKQCEEWERSEAEMNEKLSYSQFLLQELQAADLNAGEQEELEEKLNLLKHADTIKQVVQEGLFLLETNEQNSVLQLLYRIESLLQKQQEQYGGLSELTARISAARIELKDIAQELFRLDERIGVCPEELEKVALRLDRLYTLETKHRVATVEELMTIRDNLSRESDSILSLSENIQNIKEQISKNEQKLLVLGEKIHKARVIAAEKISQNVLKILPDLGMAQARWEIVVQKETTFQPNGMDTVSFLFSANQGSELHPLDKVISGGELSRLMLAVKSVLSDESLLPTIIFDEIDTGVSGDIAGKVGRIMRRMAEKRQVIAITHLPQIAAQADTHLSVYKETHNDRTESHIQILNKEERITEIAKMLSGETLTEAAVENARTLLAE